MIKRIAATLATVGAAVATGAVAFAGPASAAVDCHGAACNDQTFCEDYFGSGMKVLSEVRLNTRPTTPNYGYVALRRTGCQAFVAEAAGIFDPHTIWLNDYAVLQPNGAPTPRGTETHDFETSSNSRLWSSSPMQACVQIAGGPAAGVHCTAVAPM